MKFLNFEQNQKTQLGVIYKEEVIAISSIKGYENITCMIELIKKVGDDVKTLEKAILDSGNLEKYDESKVVVKSPIKKPIHDVLCVGVNYKAHLEESVKAMPSIEEPKKPVFFSKRSSNILGPVDDVPNVEKWETDFDYEVELAVIIGKEGIDIKASEVEDYIFGYSVFNDLSARNLQKSHQQWYKGKSLDNTSIMGPYIVHKSEIAYPPQLDISCSINGEVRQSSNTNMLIHDIGSLIEQLSAGCTLEAGDIIITGTPAGVGMGFNPPKYLKIGDVMECTVEKVGTITNKIV
ncbi:MAG: fumarylacetoacetate hydrolase family protein [Clostridia bacterium]